MEFLYRLYSNDYFGIGLFIVITILAFSFLVILFFGKKDEKAKLEQQAEKEKVEKEENVENKEEEIELNDLEPITIKEEELSEKESNLVEENETDESDLFVTSNIVLNTDYISEENEDSSVQKNDDRDIDDIFNTYNDLEEPIDVNEIIDEEEIIPIIEEEVEENNLFSNPKETKKSSIPFSSVYLNKEDKQEAESQMKQEEQKSVKTTFEMPKRVDLPKRNSDTSTTNENIISSFTDDEKENK